MVGEGRRGIDGPFCQREREGLGIFYWLLMVMSS